MEGRLKILVLGSHGMIGSGLIRYLQEMGYQVNALSRSQFEVFAMDSLNIIADKLTKNAQFIEADWVINCIGIVKQYEILYDHKHIEYMNGIFPQFLSEIIKGWNKKLLHISSDCVFSGSTGNYDETIKPDALDVYGKSKALGEVISDTSLVVRTSTIGIENGSTHGLLSWYSSQIMPVEGYKNVIYSGVSLRELCVSIHHLWDLGVDKGLYNVSGEPISKFDLLSLLYMLAIGPKPIPTDHPKWDRSLDDTKYRTLTKLKKPNWVEMSHHIKMEIEEARNAN